MRGGLDGAAVLDLYAGSGAVGLEALSRGAADVVLVESDSRAAQVIRQNIEAVGLPGARLVNDKVERVVSRHPDGRPRDFVFADPPYVVSDDELRRVLAALLERDWLIPGALVALERATRSGPPSWPAGYEHDRSRRYGEATLWYGLAAGTPTCCDTPTGE